MLLRNVVQVVGVGVALCLTLCVVLPVAHAQRSQKTDGCNDAQDGVPDLQIKACTQIIESHSQGHSRAVAFFNRGSAYVRSQQYDRAIADYNEAIRLDPKYAAAFYDRGATYDTMVFDERNRGAAPDDQHDWDRAIADYSEAIRLDPRYAAAFYRRGYAYQRKGDKERAVADYRKALELDPEDYESQDALDRLENSAPE